MQIIQGKYNIANVFTDNIEQETVAQIIEFCNQESSKDSKIRVMPDCHSGAGCVIGTTMTITDKVMPNFVGVDIGCGMFTVPLNNVDLNLPDIDNFIRKEIPHGFAVRNKVLIKHPDINDLLCLRDLKNHHKFNLALGTLGGGNHFIEIDQGKDEKYLVVHSGSRNLGLQVANYYQQRAYEYHNGIDDKFEQEKMEIIKNYKQQGKKQEIRNAIEELKKKHKKQNFIPKNLCYLEGQLMKDYLHDMRIMQHYALVNRNIIVSSILSFLQKHQIADAFHTVHNYIDLNSMILRKGAISAKLGEKVLIPINMRDGSLLCVGKGNPDWNFSAPHGAGRLMSRTKAKEELTLTEFSDSMEGIYTTSVNKNTLDESPMAYKPMQEIIDNIKDTVDILENIKPIYNFKAGDE